MSARFPSAIGRWFELTSTTVAPIRFAKRRSASGGMAWSAWATRYHEATSTPWKFWRARARRQSGSGRSSS